MYTIGIDVGGTNLKAGLVDENGKILEKNTVKSAATADEVIVNMAKQINSLLDNRGLTVENIKGIGIGCPGAISGYKGVVDILPNLGWYNVPLADRIKEYLIHISIVIITIFIFLPFFYYSINKLVLLTLENYKQTQINFEKLYNDNSLKKKDLSKLRYIK